MPKLLGFLFGLFLLSLGGTFAFFSWRESRNEKANALFSRALQTYQAELLKENESTPSMKEVPRFKTVTERSEASLKVLEQLTDTYPNVAIASLADLVRADILFDLNRWKEAEALYRKKTDSILSEPLHSFVVEALALSLETQNQKQEAMKIYKEEGEKGTTFYRPFFQADEARLLLSMGNPKQAAERYHSLLQLTDWSSSMKIRLQNRLLELE